MNQGPAGKLLVLDPGVKRPEAEGTEVVSRLWGGAVEVRCPALKAGDGPGPGFGYDFSGVVIMGSLASVHDADPWLLAVRAWLSPLVTGKARMPVFGICFGHQLVAHAAGGQVGYLNPDHSSAVGFRETTFSGGRLIPGPETLPVMVSHGEVVTRIPEGYRVTAAREGVPVDALEHAGDPVFSVQFHPEGREKWAARHGLPQGEQARSVFRAGDRLLAAFLDLARRRY